MLGAFRCLFARFAEILAYKLAVGLTAQTFTGAANGSWAPFTSTGFGIGLFIRIAYNARVAAVLVALGAREAAVAFLVSFYHLITAVGASVVDEAIPFMFALINGIQKKRNVVIATVGEEEIILFVSVSG